MGHMDRSNLRERRLGHSKLVHSSLRFSSLFKCVYMHTRKLRRPGMQGEPHLDFFSTKRCDGKECP